MEAHESFQLPLEIWRLIFTNLDFRLILPYATISQLFNNKIVFQSITSLDDYKVFYLKDHIIPRFESLTTLALSYHFTLLVTDAGMKTLRLLHVLIYLIVKVILQIMVSRD